MSSLHSYEIHHDTNMPDQSMLWLSYIAAAIFVIASFVFIKLPVQMNKQKKNGTDLTSL